MISPEQRESTEQDAQSWIEAKNVVSVIGDVPRFFSTTVHYLKKDERKGRQTMSSLTESYVAQLLRSESFLAAMYYAGKSYFPERIIGQSLKSPITLARIYQPGELATLVSLLYLYRRIRKGCDPEFFQHLSANFVADVDYGGILGRFLPRIGIQTGLIVGGAPHLGRAMFLGVDKKNFIKYSEYLKKKNLPSLFSMEHEFWGCNQLQVSILLLQTLGFGNSIYNTLITGLTCETLKEAEKDEELYRAKIARLWIDSLRATTQPPQITHRGEFYPLAEDLSRMLTAAKDLANRNPEESWLNRGKKDLSSELTPELFVKPEEGADITTEIVEREDQDARSRDELEETLNQLD